MLIFKKIIINFARNIAIGIMCKINYYIHKNRML